LNRQEARVASLPKAFLEENTLRFLNTILWLLEYNPMAETLTCFWITIEKLTRGYKKVPFTILQILPSPSGRCCVSAYSEASNKENTGLCSLRYKTLLYVWPHSRAVHLPEPIYLSVYQCNDTGCIIRKLKGYCLQNRVKVRKHKPKIL